MSDVQTQLAEIEELIALSPDDPSLRTLREDLLELIALEEEQQTESVEVSHDEQAGSQSSEPPPSSGPAGIGTDDKLAQELPEYSARGTFTEHFASDETVAAAPDLAPFAPVVNTSSSSRQAAVAAAGTKTTGDVDTTAAADVNSPAPVAEAETPKKTKKKKKSSKNDELINAKFEYPAHLLPLDSDSAAQKVKKQRAGKALKSRFRAKQKEEEADKKQNDWKSFATGGKKKKMGSGSMFATEEGVNAKVGVISGGGGGRKMTSGQGGGGKRHKFT